MIREAKLLPAAEIWLLYEAGSQTPLGPQSRTLQSFATDSAPSTYFPDSVEFYGSPSFLDDPIENAVRGLREPENYTDAQKRQAIGKGVLRIIYRWAKFYMIIGQDRMSSRLIDEAWAIYVGVPGDGTYPNSPSALAHNREGNFGRKGTIDIQLRLLNGSGKQPKTGTPPPATLRVKRSISASMPCSTWLPSGTWASPVMTCRKAKTQEPTWWRPWRSTSPFSLRRLTPTLPQTLPSSHSWSLSQARLQHSPGMASWLPSTKSLKHCC